MNLDKKALGLKGEELTISYLKKLGFRIIDQNYKQRFGEIDIIAQKKEILAFVEVKLRIDPKFPLADLINYSKQQKIIKTALHYISKNNFIDVVYRFDVALITLKQNQIELNYIENAFTAHNNY